MDIFTKLTENQRQKLVKVGIRSWYQLIGYLPYKLDQIKPFGSYVSNDSSYQLLEGILESFSQPKNYFLVKIRHLKGLEELYFFKTSPFTRKMLYALQGKEVQALVQRRGVFFSLDKIAEKRSKRVDNVFVIGSSDPQKTYLVPKYPAKGILKSAFFEMLHRSKKQSDYVLDLRGLVPDDQALIPKVLDLSTIHQPKSTKDFYMGLRTWKLFNLFLRFSLVRYHEIEQKHDKSAIGISVDIEFLKSFTSKLPFELSQSQKQAIWEVLGEMSVESKLPKQ
jgi:RecG-like helicase